MGLFRGEKLSATENIALHTGLRVIEVQNVLPSGTIALAKEVTEAGDETPRLEIVSGSTAQIKDSAIWLTTFEALANDIDPTQTSLVVVISQPS